MSRRNFLQHGGVGLAALMMPRLVRGAEAATGGTSPGRRARSVIFLLLEGGMSHLETWDPKPDAPEEIRGEFGQIQTTNPDLRIGEHMPLLAAQAHRYNVVRSVHSAARNHSPGLHWVLTGYDNPAAGVNGQKVNTYPSAGSVVSHQLGSTTADGLPGFVAVPGRAQLGGRVRFAGAKHLGASHEAFESGPVPERADAAYSLPTGITLAQPMDARRLQSRRALLEELGDVARQIDAAAGGLSDYQQQAFGLLLGDRGREAFDINQEPAATRQAYGHSAMGQGTLLARRLVEAGVHYVLVNYSKNNSWDTHKGNFTRLKKTLLPPMDRAVSTLLADLDERGLLDETLVVMMGEMGRTPKINKNAGRDHWPDVYSALLAGGGLTRGRVLGTSSRGGERPDERPVHVEEILATVYAQLGIDPRLILRDALNRPVHILPGGEARPVWELT